MANGELPPQAPGAQTQGQPTGSSGGGASQLVVDIQDKMTQLMDLLSGAQGIAPEDKQAFQGIMSAYDQFVTQNLGSAPGAKPQTQETPQRGGTPMEAGARQVQPAL